MTTYSDRIRLLQERKSKIEEDIEHHPNDWITTDRRGQFLKERLISITAQIASANEFYSLGKQESISEIGTMIAKKLGVESIPSAIQELPDLIDYCLEKRIKAARQDMIREIEKHNVGHIRPSEEVLADTGDILISKEDWQALKKREGIE